MDHVFSIIIKNNNGEIGHNNIIINCDSNDQIKIWRWMLMKAYELVEREKVELVQAIRLS